MIWCVDDDDTIREIEVYALTQTGFEAKGFADGKAISAEGKQVLVARMNKNKKFQKEQLQNEGYTEFVEYYKDPLKN